MVFTLHLTDINLPKTLGEHSEYFDFLNFWFLDFDFFDFFFLLSEAMKSYTFSKTAILEDLDLLTMGNQ